MSAPAPDGRDRAAMVVDARGHRCPTPTLRLRRALEQAEPEDVVALIADDPLARIDVPHFARQAGHDVVGDLQSGPDLTFWIRKGRGAKHTP